MRNACKILRIDKNTAVCGFWMRREISIFLKLWQHDNHPSRPSPGLQPATRRWRAFVRRSSGRPASTKRTSATAARRSPFFFARRPRSRLGIPARLRRSGGEASARLGCISLPPACVATAPRRLRPLVSARLHPRPGRRRNISKFGYKCSMILSHAYRKI